MAEVTTLCVQAIEDRIRDNLASFAPMIADDIAWQGMDFRPGETDWMRPVTLFLSETEWWTSGASGTGKNIVRGLLTCSIFTAPGYGMSALDGYASAFRELFDRASLTIAGHSALQFDPAGGPRPGPTEDEWLSIVIDCPFSIEENGS